MDKKYIQENEIDIRYLRGQLNDEELELFEIYLMENVDVDVVEELEVADLMNSTMPLTDKKMSIASRSWTSLFNTFAPALCILLVGVSSVLTFLSYNAGDKQIELFAVRGDDRLTPSIKLTLGQKIWPFTSQIVLKAQVARPDLFVSAIVEKDKSDGSGYDLIDSFSSIQRYDNGDIGVEVDLKSLDKGQYRVTFNQRQNADTDLLVKPWKYQFDVR